MAATKRAKRVRKAEGFSIQQLLATVRPSPFSCGAYSWDLETIRSARDAQMAGRFASAVRLAASMRTDDAIFVARKNRLAPLRSLAIELDPASGSKGASISAEADALFGQHGLAVTRDTIADINGALADHGVAIGYNTYSVRADGSRVDMEHRAWPLDGVWYDSLQDGFVAYAEVERNGQTALELMPIVHGDGRWTIYTTHKHLPFQQDAAILPGALVWARHAFAARDLSRGSASHGNAKIVGTMAEGTELQVKNDAGALVMSDEATAFLALLQDVASLDTPVGIAPSGAKIEYITNQSRAWEVWRELMLGAEKAAARIYLGTDGTLGSTGGAPGVDISALFGIATVIMQSDIAAFEGNFHQGVMEPWCAINFGDSALAPRLRFVVPDPDEQRSRENYATNEAAYCKAITDRRAAGLTVTQEYCDELAERYGVRALELAAQQSTGFQLAPTDLARVITANEGRSSVGLVPRDDGDVPLVSFGVPAAPQLDPALPAP